MFIDPDIDLEIKGGYMTWVLSWVFKNHKLYHSSRIQSKGLIYSVDLACITCEVHLGCKACYWWGVQVHATKRNVK